MAKYHGSVEELQAAVAATGTQGKWSTDGAGKHVFRSVNGVVLTWWSGKGTLLYQGDAGARATFEHSLDAVLNGDTVPTPVTGAPTVRNHIFIVHGHDVDARDQLELTLRRLGLEPFILMNSSGGGEDYY